LEENKYRVFISYSHGDRKCAENLARILEGNGLLPIWDKNLKPGQPFGIQIKNYIAHSHVFIPIITEASLERGWVHQEIGYAVALNIPVIPIAIGAIPIAMLSELHAVVLDSTLSGAQQIFSCDAIEKCMLDLKTFETTYHYTEMKNERARKIAELANYVKDLKIMDSDDNRVEILALLRQKGGCSSFQIPNKITSASVWAERYYPERKDDEHCEVQRNERIALEKHAKAAGCKLIINPALILQDKFDNRSKIARLETFLLFLNTMTDDKLDVVFDDKLEFRESITIVGDWFSTESYYRSEDQGFKHSSFTRHAPTILHKIQAFDDEFEELMESNGTKAGVSRAVAITRIEELLKKFS
jgi:hypothetical protein